MPEIAASMRLAGQPLRLLATLDQIFSRELNRVFSTSLLVYPDGDGQRVFTSDPVTFPLGGRKALLGRAWSDHVIGRAMPYVSRSAEEISRTMLDADWVDRLGCHCLLNMPIVHDGTVVGTFNIGTAENRFVGAELDYLETLLTLIGPSLALARLRSEGAEARQLESMET